MAKVLSPTRAWSWLSSLVLLLSPGSTLGQQFYGDNQWVAPHGVGTLIGTVGEDYTSGTLVAALVEGWEFNAQATHYWEDPRSGDDSYTAFNFFVKHRFSENERGTAGYGVMAGTGHSPDHVAQGQVTTRLAREARDLCGVLEETLTNRLDPGPSPRRLDDRCSVPWVA